MFISSIKIALTENAIDAEVVDSSSNCEENYDQHSAEEVLFNRLADKDDKQ